MMHAAKTTKRVLAASVMAFGLAGLGGTVSAGVGFAEPLIWDEDGYQNTPDSGTYDELNDLAMEGCWASGVSAGCHHLRLAGSYGDNGTVASSWPGPRT